MLPTAHLHHHHHHHYQPILGSQSPTDPQWQAHPHFHARSAGRRVDLGDAFAEDTSPLGTQPAAAAAAGESYSAGASDISPSPGASSKMYDTREQQRAGGLMEGGGGIPGSRLRGAGGGRSGGMYGSGGGGGGGSVASVGSYYGTAGGGRGGATRYPRLRSLQWLWSAVVWYWSTVAWVVTLPWKIFTWLTPGFLKPAEEWVESTLEWWTGPPIRLAADVLYGIISWFDGLLSYGRRSVSTTHKSNMHHFWVAYEAYLRLIQHKAHLIEKHGFDGLWMALHTKTV
ncbi:hypothetical protein PLESTB_000896100 [Pleodorina starrii]|uniref:Uncharacterized protein n=1 Tax=Pleodorina starrii TaxID=330485 RepID=A0A9W6BMG2_9CHLO|nr:hypothetical protein PLESTM_000884900 [Pleodorina starrii]GLC54693.1 hypothetical protein PLESTB_000896100 [Pleodorina starrii]GLC67030.1 hypothetical protein PLESTF_000503800 [Pleodorina starrii]